MYELEKQTVSVGRPGRISSTVDAKQPRLVEYYRRQGGTIQSSGDISVFVKARGRSPDVPQSHQADCSTTTSEVGRFNFYTFNTITATAAFLRLPSKLAICF